MNKHSRFCYWYSYNKTWTDLKGQLLDRDRAIYFSAKQADLTRIRADSHSPLQSAFSAIDCVNAGIEKFLSLCGDATVHYGICTSVNEFLEVDKMIQMIFRSFLSELRSFAPFDPSLFLAEKLLRIKTGGQPYKAPTIVIYVSRVVNMSNLLVIMSLES